MDLHLAAALDAHALAREIERDRAACEPIVAVPQLGRRASTYDRLRGPVVARVLAARAARALADLHTAARRELARLALARLVDGAQHVGRERERPLIHLHGAPERQGAPAVLVLRLELVGGDRDRLAAVECAETERGQVGPGGAGGAREQRGRERRARAAGEAAQRHGRCSTRTLPSSSKRRSCTW